MMALRRTRGCVLLAIITAAVCSTGDVFAQSASAQVRARWEYCAITESFGATSRSGGSEGIAKIVYFGDGDATERIVRVEGATIDGPALLESALETARLSALSKAIFLLGESGWELVGELPYGPLGASGDAPKKALYFKRQRR